MPVKQTIPFTNGIFFITFTCYQWLNLIELVNGYDIVYKWFDHLRDQGHFINGYVIMPNHVHALLSFIETEQSINTIVGNGKRFMAYEIVSRLKTINNGCILEELAIAAKKSRKKNNKIHEVWNLSFDWKHCYSPLFIDQKLNYIHSNPCAGKWSLCITPEKYVHSSAQFYSSGVQGIYPVTNILEMEDVLFIR